MRKRVCIMASRTSEGTEAREKGSLARKIKMLNREAVDVDANRNAAECTKCGRETV